MIYEDGIKVIVADASHEKYVDLILDTIREAAKKRGTGIAERTHEYVATKMKEGKAVLALDPSQQTELGDKFVGFSYIETWGNKSYVTTSGLIVHPDYQGRNIAKRIKDHTFTLARVRWPHAKIFSLTSGDAVMKMNTALGYVPVSFNQLTDDDAFWRGCRGCVNHPILEMKNRKFCICTGMLYDPAQHKGEPTPVEIFQEIMKEMVKRESPLPTSPKGEE
ncbi:MAG: GNAT family N-acetyltransferase [Bacteroidaceae bacterium]|nr:GNAT family N-acetyltransferase [Bacteroidaceae bacterium]